MDDNRIKELREIMNIEGQTQKQVRLGAFARQYELSPDIVSRMIGTLSTGMTEEKFIQKHGMTAPEYRKMMIDELKKTMAKEA